MLFSLKFVNTTFRTIKKRPSNGLNTECQAITEIWKEDSTYTEEAKLKGTIHREKRVKRC